MVIITERIQIQAPIEAVFDFACDYSNDPQWRKGVIEHIVDNPLQTGSKAREVLRFMGSDTITNTEVTRFEPNKLVAFQSVSGPYPVSGYRRVEYMNGATEFTYHLKIEVSGFMKWIKPLAVMMFQQQVRGDLARLKQMLEMVRV